MITKSELRKEYKSKRKRLDGDTRASHSEAIASLYFSDFEPASVTHIFIPIVRFFEVDTWKIIHQLHHNDLITCTSVSNFKTGTMETVAFTSEIEFVVSEYGIPEPVGGPHIHPHDVDRVIMPLLAFDNEGNRVGYGKGFYDKFLASCRPSVQKIGVSYFPPASQSVPTLPTDIKLDFCVTPEKVYSF
mgnify:CR=1 FL=1